MELTVQPRGGNPWSRLEQPSRRVVIGFSARAALVLVLVGAASEPLAAIQAYASMNVVMSGVLAIVLRHPFNGAHFTLWDDALWFSAISHAAQMARA